MNKLPAKIKNKWIESLRNFIGENAHSYYKILNIRRKFEIENNKIVDNWKWKPTEDGDGHQNNQCSEEALFHRILHNFNNSK